MATVEDLKRRYPAFDAVADATVLYWLQDADARLGDVWVAPNRDIGEMMLAAHNMALIGLGSGAMVVGVTSFKSGTFSATVSDKIASMTGYNATVYGREYLALCRRLFGGARLVNTASHV